jgi:hypothetical protein
MGVGTRKALGARFRGVAWLVGLLLLASPRPALAQAAGDVSAAGVAGRSLILPGWGQKELGQRRGLAYALAEVTFWTLWADRRHKGNTLATEYRDLAWREARVQTGARADPAWAYYETLSKWTRSGAFDRDPTSGGIQPEDDLATFNGSIWRLAVDLHFPQGVDPDPGTPAYAAAVTWYGDHAYGEDFLWDWSGKDGELAEYKDLIHRSDHRFSQATAALGAVLANHLLSATDAFLSSKVPGEARLRALPPLPGAGFRTGFILEWKPE